MIKNAQDLLSTFLKTTKREQEYLDCLLDHGDYRPELLFPEPELAKKLSQHPVLLWKARNIREHISKK